MRRSTSVLVIAATIAAAACSGATDEVGGPGASGTGSSSTRSGTAGASASGSNASDRGASTSAGAGASSTAGVGASTPSSNGSSSSSNGASSGGPTDAGASARDASPTHDASVVDAGAQPYKGVANSACGDLTKLGASWYYNWTLTPQSCTTVPFVPMVWGHTGAEQSGSGIAQEVSSLVSAGYDTVLGFNEPDNTSQSNITVSAAIALWPSFNNPAVSLGSPATQANTTGITWLTSFMSQVNADTTGTLRVDFIAAHWYGWNSGSCDAKAATLEAYLKQVEAIPGNRPIWLTEWGCLNQSNPSEAVVQAFLSGALTMLAKHPRVVRYAWYPWTTNNELVGDAGLTSLGDVFAAAPATR